MGIYPKLYELLKILFTGSLPTCWWLSVELHWPTDLLLFSYIHWKRFGMYCHFNCMVLFEYSPIQNICPILVIYAILWKKDFRYWLPLLKCWFYHARWMYHLASTWDESKMTLLSFINLFLDETLFQKEHLVLCIIFQWAFLSRELSWGGSFKLVYPLQFLLCS